MKKSWIKVRSFGGTNKVTGSGHMVTATIDGYDYNYLVDCGLFQGYFAKKHPELNFNLRKYVYDINGIFITHSHIDHIGRLPAMYRWGYTGPIYATEPVCALAGIMLEDSARIQLDEYKVNSERELAKKLAGDLYKDVELLYDPEDAKEVMNQFEIVPREEEIRINEYLTVMYHDAGHSLGSAFIEMIFNNGEETFKLVFSGDLGNENNLILKEVDYPYITGADAVFCETTYAGRYHGSQIENWGNVRVEIAKTLINGGRVLAGCIASGRAEEFMYSLFIDMMENDDWVAQTFRKYPISVDSLLTVLNINEFKKFPEEFKPKLREYMSQKGNNPFDFPNLELVYSKEESIALCSFHDPRIIISAAGMFDAGRVVYHLREIIEREDCLLVFTCYQAEGTLGRKLLDGEKFVNVAKKYCEVKVPMIELNTYSSHADQNGLENWLCNNIEPGYMLFLNHGEEESQIQFKELLENFNTFSAVEILKMDTIYELSKDGFEKIELAHDEPIKKRENNLRHKDAKCIAQLTAQLSQLEDEEGCERICQKISQEINQLKTSSRKKFVKNRVERYKKGYKG